MLTGLIFSLLVLVAAQLRPPAVPLVVQDPYISIWSMSDKLTDGWAQHWDGGKIELLGMINIDGMCYTFMGKADKRDKICEKIMPQVNLVVTPTQTTYEFLSDNIKLTLQFTTPAILDDVSYLQIPATYLTFTVKNLDAKEHQVALYYDNTGEVAVNMDIEKIRWKMYNVTSQFALSQIGTETQKFDEDVHMNRIDWGFWYVGAQVGQNVQVTVAQDVNARSAFEKG